jgi:predicted GNAT family N-acyltransferase
MENPTIIIKRPKDCAKSELQKFEQLVVEGGQVKPDGLDEKVRGCMFLAFCFVGNELASVAALKNKAREYVESLYDKTGTSNKEDLPLIEIGYCFTNHHHRGKKYNSLLVDSLLQKAKGKLVFATTGNPIMKSFFEKRGFQKVGNPYDGVYNKDIILYIKNTKA